MDGEFPVLGHRVAGDAHSELVAALEFMATVGYPDLTNALKKAEATGTSNEDILANAGKPSFMVVDMRKALGMMVQPITPRAKRLHDAILRAATDWDGETDLLRRLG